MTLRMPAWVDHACLLMCMERKTEYGTYLPTYLPTYLHTYIHTYKHTYFHTYVHTYLPTSAKYIHGQISRHRHSVATVHKEDESASDGFRGLHPLNPPSQIPKPYAHPDFHALSSRFSLRAEYQHFALQRGRSLRAQPKAEARRRESDSKAQCAPLRVPFKRTYACNVLSWLVMITWCCGPTRPWAHQGFEAV